MKIVKLDIDENSILAGIDAVALVEQPAIEEDFMYFSKQEFAETYNDYPQAAVEAAKQGIKRNKENNNKCATQVGKVRAQQLANGENLSFDTIRRMRSFLIRQKDNYELQRDRKNYDACGYISYLLWGGEAALPWAEKKLRQAGEEFDLEADTLPDYNNEVSGSLIKKEFIDPNPCQTGYIAYGTKIKNGREVPNCVPKEGFNGLLLEDFLKTEVFNIVDRIEGVPVYSEKQEAIDKAKELGCEGYHEHTLASGEVVYMPCSEHTEATDKILSQTFDDMGTEEQDAIINALDNAGISDEDMLGAGYIEVDKDSFYRQAFAQIITSPNKPSQADFGNLAVRYKYTGPKDNKNRKFCSRLMSLNKIFRKEDINNLSIKGENTEFGIYDIFRYKGSYNCRHYWAEKFYKRDSNISAAGRALADSNRILDGTTTNNPVIQKTGKVDSVPGLAKTEFAALDEKQMLVGPLMVPNKLIPRIDDEGNEYYVYFTEETIKKLSYKMMKDKLIDAVNIEHDNNDRVEDAFLVESWLIEDADTDKSRKYGFNLPNGTWMGMYKIDNLNIWEDYVKTGLVKGFSIEGFFEQYTMSKTKCRKNGQCACGRTENPNGLCDGSHLK
jgi:hypothetical protein